VSPSSNTSTGAPEELELLLEDELLEEDELVLEALEEELDEALELLPEDAAPAPPHPANARISQRKTDCFRNLMGTPSYCFIYGLDSLRGAQDLHLCA